MRTFEFFRPTDATAAVATAAEAKTAQQGADVRFVAGGTTLIDLMKLNVETPVRLIDINHLPLDKIEPTPDGGLKIGATVRNTDLARHPTVQREYSVLSQAIMSGASTQLRNEPAACIFATPPWPATSASRDQVARRSPAAIAAWPSSARAITASRPIHPTCV